MGSSQGSTLTANVAEFTKQSLDSSTPRSSYLLDNCPVYVKELIAGGAAGGFAKTAVAPLERIKILFQTRSEGFHSLGIFQSLRKLLKHEGIRGFYKGNGASVLRIVPYAALHFMTYEQYRCWILNNVASLGTGPVVDLLAGSAAGGTAVLCTYPLDLARTKLAYQVAYRSGVGGVHINPTYNGIKDVFQKVYAEGGVRSLYRGVGSSSDANNMDSSKELLHPTQQDTGAGPTLIGILPYAGLKFYVYEELKRHVPEEYQKSVIMRLSCGALAGLLGQTFTYPLDVVRRQMQVQNMPPSSEPRNPGFRSTMEGLTTIIHKQGWRQLFAGLSINYVKVVPSVAIGFATYDVMKVWLGVPPRERIRSAST